jgi:hypothetical protein
MKMSISSGGVEASSMLGPPLTSGASVARPSPTISMRPLPFLPAFHSSALFGIDFLPRHVIYKSFSRRCFFLCLILPQTLGRTDLGSMRPDHVDTKVGSVGCRWFSRFAKKVTPPSTLFLTASLQGPIVCVLLGPTAYTWQRE